MALPPSSAFLTTMVLAWVGLIFALLFWFLWWKPRRMERFFRQQGMDGTSYRFPVGDVMEQWKSRIDAMSRPMPLSHNILRRISPWLQQKTQKHGKIRFGWNGPYAQVAIADPHLIREVWADKSGRIGRTRLNRQLKLLASGILSYDGKKWSKHRRIINPAFHVEKLKLMAPAFVVCCAELIGRWEEMVALEGSRELDLWPEFQTFSGDVISRTAFGSSYEEGRRIFLLQMEQASNVVQNVLGEIIPGYSFLPTKKNRRTKAIDREVKHLLRNIVERREKEAKLGNARRDDLLGLLLDSSRRYSEEGGGGERGMTTEDVIEECRLFYFAGQETTASLLTWTMVVLSMHQTWQERAREEVLRVVGGEKPEIDDLGQMKVVTMVLLEVLRLYPPVPFIFETVKETTKVGDFWVPGGVDLLFQISSVHHDPETWGDDAHEFKPERFSEGISKTPGSQAGYFPFGWGPRICVGQKFAMVEAKFFLAMLLRRFRFELSPSYAHAPLMVVTLRPQYGVQIILHKLRAEEDKMPSE